MVTIGSINTHEWKENDNQRGGIYKPNMFFYGVPVYFSTSGDLKYGAAFTLPGIGIFINPKQRNDINLLRHEFGHVLVARHEGFLTFYEEDVPESLLSAFASKDDLQHQHSPTEMAANDASFLYFGRPTDWDFINYPVHSSVLASTNTDHQYDNIDAGFASGFH